MTGNPHLPYIETPRLILAIPTPDYASRMLQYVDDNRAHLAAWEPLRPDEYFTLDFWSRRLSFAVEEFTSDRCLSLVLLDRTSPSAPFVGQVTFSNITRGALQAAYLGYSLDHRAIGNGLMYEALTAAIKYVFEEMNLHRVMANYMPTNERSGKLLRRLGFAVEGYARDYLMLAGDWQDHILTALTNESWEPQDLSESSR